MSLAIIYPEILRMQVRAIIEAAINVQRAGIEVHPEIMIPLVGHYKSSSSPERALEVIEKVFEEQGMHVEYKIGDDRVPRRHHRR